MDMKERSAMRRKRMVFHRAKNFEDAERWDLEFLQNQSPADRLSALVAIRKNIEKVRKNPES